MRSNIGLWTAAGAAALLASGCGRKTVEPAPSPKLHAPARPAPPAGAIDSLKLPPADGKGGYRTINSDLSPSEAMWHLRAALNVAALTCDRPGTMSIARNYNRLLGRQRTLLAAAYRAEGQRLGSAAATDAHVTQVYNFFAQPPVQARFCAVAGAVSAEAAALPAEGLEAFAPVALDRLMAPFLDFYRAYARYQTELAAWRKGGPITPRAAVALTSAAAPPAAGPPWRIQLGAYSGDRAARDAWGRIRSRMRRAADFEPAYEETPDGQLVRVRIGPVTDRSTAIALCAAAAGAGLDCLPVPPRA